MTVGTHDPLLVLQQFQPDVSLMSVTCGVITGQVSDLCNFVAGSYNIQHSRTTFAMEFEA